ncbi:unnamed protein product, partial [marine sediment metagenome]
MLVKLENPVQLSRVVELISELVTEVRIKISDIGLSIVAMDPANVAMVGFWLPKTAFSLFEAGEVMPDLILVSPRHLFRAPYSLHEKTALASVVLKPEEIKNFQPTDADPLKAKVRE